jgi:hypothetical protein
MPFEAVSCRRCLQSKGGLVFAFLDLRGERRISSVQDLDPVALDRIDWKALIG